MSEKKKERRLTEQEIQKVAVNLFIDEVERAGKELKQRGNGNDIFGTTQDNHADPQGEKRD